ncbi:MAG TPA: TIGR03936 family radical SAM-associated protein, partial [Allocoleopsis sp.]
GEIVDFELTRQMEVEEFKERLAGQLPSDIPVYRVEQVDLAAPSATQSLERAQYLITVARVQSLTPLQDASDRQQWKNWVEAVKSCDVIEWEQTTKSGKKKQVNLRDRLFELELVEVKEDASSEPAVVRYIGSCRNDGTLLRPEHLVYMLEQVNQLEFQLLHAHRSEMILAET